jgi:protease-4
LSVNNLHSLINGKWFIHKPYGQALLPSLFSILEGKDLTLKSPDRESDFLISAKTSKSTIVSAASYFSGENKADEYVAIVRLKDPIYKYDQECGPSGTKSKMNRMDAYKNDDSCVGVVLDIDSGGGQVSGTPEFYDFISAFGKPVVAYTDGMMCSAAYYIGSAASYLIANKRADAIGSIGVMVHFIDVTGMYEKKGATVITEYATQSTEKNRAFEELLKGNADLYIKTELDTVAETFINDIKSVRSGVSEEAFKGGTWDAQGSLERNLIDSIGTLQDAVNKAFELSKSGSTNSNNNKNSKKATMSKKTKSFAAIQEILAIEGEGIATISTITGKSGVQITEAHLEKLENALVAKDAALVAANSKVTTAEGNVTTIETAVNAAITIAKLEGVVEAEATTAQKIEVLGAKVLEYGKKPGSRATTPKADGDNFEEEDDLIDPNASHNQMYNKA